jgi:hypothetical protein
VNRRRLALVIAITALVVLGLALLASLFFVRRAPREEVPVESDRLAQPRSPAPPPETKEAPAEAKEAAPEEGSAGRRVKSAPVVVEKNGVKRASCDGACALEQQCGFRALDECQRASCDGDVRVANKSDFCLADAKDCGAAAACPCEEACWKRGECAGDHDGDKACTASCSKLVAHDPSASYDENRCIIESKCDAIAACGGQRN